MVSTAFRAKTQPLITLQNPTKMYESTEHNKSPFGFK